MGDARSIRTATWEQFTSIASRIWWWFRQVSGDAAYENYVRGAKAAQAAGALLTREEFYLDALCRRYSGVSRCC